MMTWKPTVGWRVIDSLFLVILLGLIGSIFVPVYSSNGRNRFELSNAKQCALGALIYTNDNDDRLPLSARWMDLELPYVTNKQIFNSPAVKDAGQYGFAFRRALSGHKLSLTKSPTVTAMIFDSIETQWNANGNLLLLPNPGRYNGKDVVAFMDGHAKTVSPDHKSYK